jgi:hypothetical protein
LSKTEREFIAAIDGAKELLLVKRLLGELGEKYSEVPTLCADNDNAVKLAKMQSFISGRNTLKCGTTLYVSVTRMVEKVGTHRRTKTVRRFVGETVGSNAY